MYGVYTAENLVLVSTSLEICGCDSTIHRQEGTITHILYYNYRHKHPEEHLKR
jgi:hypothetical protein